MKINTDEHPKVKFRTGEDGLIHLVDSFGDPWCEDEIELFDDVAEGDDIGVLDMCATCYQAGVEEEALLDG